MTARIPSVSDAIMGPRLREFLSVSPRGRRLPLLWCESRVFIQMSRLQIDNDPLDVVEHVVTFAQIRYWLPFVQE